MTSSNTPDQLLIHWLTRQLPPDAVQWFNTSLTKLAEAPTERAINLAISLTARKLGKAYLTLDAGDMAAAQTARPGWQPQRWSVDQAARVAILLATVNGDVEAFRRRLTQLLRTADFGELVAFYQGLPLYPAPSDLRALAAEGVRTNMRAVFEAVAHANPYPSEQLPDGPWNQMVLKALFVGSTLAPIIGLEQRCNNDLALMLCDYAQERWAAGRAVSPELWRCVGPIITDRTLACLSRALKGDDPIEQEGAALALFSNGSETALALLAQATGSLRERAQNGELNWERLLPGGGE